MDNEALLNLYLEKLRLYTLEKLEAQNVTVQDITVIEALKASLIFLEGEMTGY